MRFKQSPEDFVVEELPAFVPSGTGEHLLLFIEKRGLSTTEVASHLAHSFACGPRDVGFAGRKDRQALTRQWFSVPGVASERAREAEREGLRVLEVSRHEQKLRLGALAGNRFELCLREVAAEDRGRIEARLEELRTRGMPNRFGAQRFGEDGATDLLGELALRRDWRGFLHGMCCSTHWPASEALDELRAVLSREGREGHRGLGRLTRSLPRELAPIARQLARRRGDFAGASRALDRGLVLFAISALQARLFNEVLSLRGSGFATPAVGDLIQRHPGRGFFLATEDDDLDELVERAARQEISPTGPIYGWKSPLAEGAAGEHEAAVIARADLKPSSFRKLLSGVSPEGARRSLRAVVSDLRAEFDADCLRLEFSLPPGSYATVLIEELAGDEPSA